MNIYTRLRHKMNKHTFCANCYIITLFIYTKENGKKGGQAGRKEGRTRMDGRQKGRKVRRKDPKQAQKRHQL